MRNGGATAGACNTAAGCDPSYVKGLLQSVSGLSTATSARVETTHQLSSGQPAGCADPGNTTVAGLRNNCGSQFYTTTF